MKSAWDCGRTRLMTDVGIQPFGRENTPTPPEFGPTAGSKRVGAPSPTGRRARLQAGDAYPSLSHPKGPRWHLPSGPC